MISVKNNNVLSKPTRTLVLLVCLNTLLLNGLIYFLSPPEYRETVLDHAVRFLQAQSANDSWTPMNAALDFYNAHPHQPLYTAMLIENGTKFQYPPPSLLIRRALNRLDLGLARDYSWKDIFGWLFMGITVLSTLGIFNRSARLVINPPPSINFGEKMLRAGLLIILTISFYPVVRAYTLGQIQVWLTALFAVSLYSWIRGRNVMAGILLGLVGLIKPQLALFLLWGLLRKEWRFTIAMGLTLVVGFLASCVAFGLQNHLDYLAALSFLSKHGEAFFSNQSFNGLANRICSIRDPIGYNNLDWHGHHFPPFTPWVYVVTIATSLLVLVLVLWHNPRRKREHSIADFCAMGLGVTLASPIAWVHHYGILLPIYAYLLPRCASNIRQLGFLLASYLLTSNYFGWATATAYTPFNVLESYLLLGACIVLWLLLLMRHEYPEETVEPDRMGARTDPGRPVPV